MSVALSIDLRVVSIHPLSCITNSLESTTSISSMTLERVAIDFVRQTGDALVWLLRVPHLSSHLRKLLSKVTFYLWNKDLNANAHDFPLRSSPRPYPIRAHSQNIQLLNQSVDHICDHRLHLQFQELINTLVRVRDLILRDHNRGLSAASTHKVLPIRACGRRCATSGPSSFSTHLITTSLAPLLLSFICAEALILCRHI